MKQAGHIGVDVVNIWRWYWLVLLPDRTDNWYCVFNAEPCSCLHLGVQWVWRLMRKLPQIAIRWRSHCHQILMIRYMPCQSTPAYSNGSASVIVCPWFLFTSLSVALLSVHYVTQYFTSVLEQIKSMEFANQLYSIIKHIMRFTG